MSIYLIRHGLTEGNIESRYVGSTDEPMSSVGIDDIKGRISHDYYPEVDIVYCSPMLRTKQTAELIYPDRTPIFMGSLRERDFGKYEMKRYDELDDDDEYQRWLASKGSLPFPGGEQRDDFIERVRTAYEVISKAAEEKDVAVITHGGVVVAMESVVRNLKRLDFSYGIKNGECIKIKD